MKHIKLFESYFDEGKTLYRWCGPAGLFMYFYGDMPGEEMQKYMFDRFKMPQLPSVNPSMEGSHKDADDESEEFAVCTTLDPNYLGEPYSGDSVVRLNLDFEKMKNDFGADKFEDLTHNGEAEVRITGNLKNWTKYLIKIDVLKEAWENTWEDDFGEWRAIKKWFPEDFKKYVKTFKNEKELIVKRNDFDKYKLRGEAKLNQKWVEQHAPGGRLAHEDED